MFVFTSGEAMGGTTGLRLPGYVAPGQTVDVSVTLSAPDKRGHYVGNWMLRNQYGVLFGFGDRANQAFYVDIDVVDLPHGEVAGSFHYPSEFNPPLILYFENAVTGEIIQFSIPESNPNYKVLLPNGTYYAYAWAPNYNLQGAYVYDNLTMKPFVVRGGHILYPIQVSDGTIGFDPLLQDEEACCTITSRYQIPVFEACRDELVVLLGEDGFEGLRQHYHQIGPNPGPEGRQ